MSIEFKWENAVKLSGIGKYELGRRLGVSIGDRNAKWEPQCPSVWAILASIWAVEDYESWAPVAARFLKMEEDNPSVEKIVEKIKSISLLIIGDNRRRKVMEKGKTGVGLLIARRANEAGVSIKSLAAACSVRPTCANQTLRSQNVTKNGAKMALILGITLKELVDAQEEAAIKKPEARGRKLGKENKRGKKEKGPLGGKNGKADRS